MRTGRCCAACSSCIWRRRQLSLPTSLQPCYPCALKPSQPVKSSPTPHQAHCVCHPRTAGLLLLLLLLLGHLPSPHSHMLPCLLTVAEPFCYALLHTHSGDNPDAVREKLVPALRRGIASHHAGCLPAWKALVERCFQRGLLKLVFATGVSAAGGGNEQRGS